MKAYMSSLGKSKVSLDKLVSALSDVQRGNFEQGEDYRELVKKLLELVPQWVTMTAQSLLAFNKDVASIEIEKAICSHFDSISS